MALNRFYRLPRIGLVLSGGGARGIAHIGVLKVLEREGVPLHCIVGTSAGGLIGAAYAAGLTAEELEHEALHMSNLRNMVSLLDRRWPQIGLFAGGKIEEYIASKIGYKDFSELATPLAVLAVDLQAGQEVILDSGSVIEAIRATISFPGVFEPCEVADRLLIDGGLLNNLPVDVPGTMGADAVIAVDVATEEGDLADFVRAAKQNRLFPQVQLTVGLFNRCVDIMMGQIRKQKLAAYPPDILLMPSSITRSVFSSALTARRSASPPEKERRRVHSPRFVG